MVATNIQKTKDNVLEHSQAKLDFYKSYLVRYLTILLNDRFTDIINLYDIFCGIGIYNDGNQGSPIIAMDIIKTLKKKYPNKEITLTINDKDSEKVGFVSTYIKENYQNICNVEAYCLDAKDMLERVKKSIKQNKNRVKNLVFIDPYGYKEIYKKDINDIMQSKKSEIIIFLPIAQMYRFSNVALNDEENNSYAHLRRFIQDFFDENHPIYNENMDSQIEYINYIKSALNYENKYFSASYSIQRDNKNYYALFFITNHIYGLDRIIETKWKLDNKCGEGFSKQSETGLFSDYYEEVEKENCLKNLEDSLGVFLSHYRSNTDLYEFSLLLGYMPNQTSEVLKRLKKENKLQFNKESQYFYIGWKYFKNNDIKYKVKLVE